MLFLKQLVAGSLFVLSSVVAGCGSQEIDEGRADDHSVEVLVMATRDFDGDGLTDLGMKTQDGTLYLATMFLNRGDGVFEWWNAETAKDEIPELASDAWSNQGAHAITELAEVVDGLPETLSQLPGARMEQLGLKSLAGMEAHWSQCPEDHLCFWQNEDYGGAFIAHNPGGCTNSESLVKGDWWNDRMSSYWNRNGCYTCLYQHTNFEGAVRQVPPGEYAANVGSFWNDRMSSWANWGSGVACFL